MDQQSVDSVLHRIWADQAEFNQLFRTPPYSFEERSAVTKEMVLAMVAECVELLNTIRWKSHRVETKLENRAHTTAELVDIFKYFLTVAQAWGVTPEEFEEAYWAKSAVCRQRHAEEWIARSTRPVVVVDLDNTLCDYITGFCDWLVVNEPDLATHAVLASRERSWVNAASMGIDEPRWQSIKHRFRVSGAKRYLPLMPGADEFLAHVTRLGYDVVILTSRPIDRYPNIYTDTLIWLNRHMLPFSALWWAHDKAERLATNSAVFDRVALFVDDEWRYVEPVAARGISCAWLTSRPQLPAETSQSVLRAVRLHFGLPSLTASLGVQDVIL